MVKYVDLDELLDELRRAGFEIEDYPHPYNGDGWIRANLDKEPGVEAYHTVLKIKYSMGRLE
jgi:hypothetical protein